MLRLLTLLLGIGAIQARIFNNPALGSGDYREPGGIKANGTYYITTRNNNDTQTLKIEIHESTDLINWKPSGYVFDETNYPVWAIKNKAFFDAKIHEIRGNYYLYFRAYYNVTGETAIGVAIAPHPLGPYTANDQPLITDIFYPTIANDNGDLYLISKINNNIAGRLLNSNGLSFASDQTNELIRPTFSWESSYIAAPWYIHRGDYHYIMYSANIYCDVQRIGVARSRNVLGPYEKLADPILASNHDFKNPIFNSCVKDLDDQSDVIVFQSYSARVGCGRDQVINMASFGWNADDWPYIYDY